MTKPTSKHSKDLKLDGPVPAFIKKLQILKNQKMPLGRIISGKWDHLLNKLVFGDCVDLEHKEAASFVNRARNLNYCIVSRKVGENKSRIWFEGLNSVPKKKKKAKKKN